MFRPLKVDVINGSSGLPMVGFRARRYRTSAAAEKAAAGFLAKYGTDVIVSVRDLVGYTNVHLLVGDDGVVVAGSGSYTWSFLEAVREIYGGLVDG